MASIQANSNKNNANSKCSLQALELSFNRTLQPHRFKDYCPNGLQVEGKSTVRLLVSGVTASLALIDAAISRKADAIVVHHGYFFRGEDERITGQKKLRLARLLRADISLFAFHLPLDAHTTLGNNTQLGRVLDFTPTGVFGDAGRGAPLGMVADLVRPLSLSTIRSRIAKRLDRQPLVIGDPKRQVKKLAWCTGAAQDMLQEAIDAGADAFISGEISERTTHLAREMGVAYIAAGHHATERYGVCALGGHIAGELGINHEFIDIDNPA
jgi:dinuclear metal center YbgI/SA1388 family protein